MTRSDAAHVKGGEENSQPTAGNYVDTHVHIWTDDFEKYPLAQGFTPQEMAPRVFSCDDILRHATPNGVSRVVLVQMSYYGFDNSYMLDAIRLRPEVFQGVAVVDWNGSDSEEKMLRLAQQGIRAFRIFPQNVPAEACLEGEGLARMFRWRFPGRLSQRHGGPHGRHHGSDHVGVRPHRPRERQPRHRPRSRSCHVCSGWTGEGWKGLRRLAGP